jgi:hypothetical protein
LGAKFGGSIVWVPAAATMVLMLAGRRVSVRRLALLFGAGVALVLAGAGIEYALVGAGSSHLGGFIGQAVSGRGVAVVGRKFHAMSHSLADSVPLTLLAAAALVAAWGGLVRPVWFLKSLVGPALAADSRLRATIGAAATLALLGLLVQDSGVILPVVGLTLALPLALVRGPHRWPEHDEQDPQP